MFSFQRENESFSRTDHDQSLEILKERIEARKQTQETPVFMHTPLTV